MKVYCNVTATVKSLMDRKHHRQKKKKIMATDGPQKTTQKRTKTNLR